MMAQLMERHGEELEAAGFGWEDAKHVIHVIVSHHGKLEYGAPTTPGTLEAQIIHQADMTSAAVRKVVNLISSTEPDRHGKYEGRWSDVGHGLRASPESYKPISVGGVDDYDGEPPESAQFSALPLNLRLDQVVTEAQAGHDVASDVPEETQVKSRAAKASI